MMRWRKLSSDELLKHSTIMFASMLAANVGNMVFHMVVGRELPQEEYTLLVAFLAVLAMIQRPLSTLRTALCHYGSLLDQQGNRGDVKRLLRKWLGLTGVPFMLMGLCIIAFSEPISGFFHLERTAPLVIAGALFPVLCWLPILNGAAQGLQIFAWNSSAAIVGAAVRVIFGVGFVVLLYPACGWAMFGHGLSIYATVAVLLLGLWLALHGGQISNQPLPSMRLYLLQCFFILAAYTVLMTADVVLVKHYIPMDTDFAYAATLGRMAMLLPGAIVTAMFPKVATSGLGTAKHKRIFLRAIAYTGCFTGGVFFVSCLVPRLLLRILYGSTQMGDVVVIYVRLMSLMMVLSAVLNVVVQYALAQRRFKALSSVVFFAGLYLASSAFFHASVLQVVTIGLCCNLSALVVSMYALLRAD
jgi:O-antigen/teichoic acid export membrane protein